VARSTRTILSDYGNIRRGETRVLVGIRILMKMPIVQEIAFFLHLSYQNVIVI